ncbi:homeodomain-interacting protein kinase 2-like [Thunnus thynnus]|uniref:homeodomain-interacting protein kinase 2-like n=1 Tax=Thunnus thynnus TaxID=8237 RepID=UPI003529186C
MASDRHNPPPKKNTLSFKLPTNYKCLEIVGKGSFGVVAKCYKRDSGETVAVKISRNTSNAKKELSMLQNLMRQELDKHNIVRFQEWFQMDKRTALVFEILDISLHDRWRKRILVPIQLQDVRTVVQQLATALNALKNVGVIHTDIKMDNIMLVDHLRLPFRVKLIDFGLAILRSEARQGGLYQTCYCRSPEIILGAPFSEAIDMWSLGCVMAAMLGVILFPGTSEHDLIRYMIDLLGQPDDNYLDSGIKSRLFFEKQSSGRWSLKIGEDTENPKYQRTYKFRSLDALKKLDLDDEAQAEVADRWECIELLKEMLKMNPGERISPSQVLSHPFIIKSHLKDISLSTYTSPPEYVDEWPRESKKSSCQGLWTTAREEISKTSNCSVGIFWSALTTRKHQDVLDQPTNSGRSQVIWMTADVLESIDSTADIIHSSLTTTPLEDVPDRLMNSENSSSPEDWTTAREEFSENVNSSPGLFWSMSPLEDFLDFPTDSGTS